MVMSEINNNKTWVRRFDDYSRFLHVMVVVSFLSLALTGLIIKFSGVGIFQSISKMMGGYAVTGFIHRAAAIVTFAYFFLHIYYILRKLLKEKKSVKYMASGENSLVPNKTDVKEFIGTFKWFMGKGKRPDYGRWTYWEKFDYFAVFWGVFVIGSTGLILWFPELFTLIGLPGWMINIATIVHSDEALLASGFIFTIHFFNTHFRPDKFPIDTVIFTGKMPLKEFIEDRPRQYKQLKESGELDKYLCEPPAEIVAKSARVFGFVALTIGISLILITIYSMLFLYS